MILAALLLSACGTNGPATEAAIETLNGCDWSKYIWVSHDDQLTAGTADQILAHNETREKICE